MSKKHFKLRKQMISEKPFLHALYTDEAKTRASRLNVASKKQIKILVKVLHCLSCGEIPIKKAQFEKIVQARKMSTLTKIHEKGNLKELLSKPFADQVRFVKKFLSLYPSLLHPIFNEY